MNFLQTLLGIVIIVGLTAIYCEQPKEGSATKDAVEDLTGMTTIKQGKTMKKKLEAIEKAAQEREKELEEIK